MKAAEGNGPAWRTKGKREVPGRGSPAEAEGEQQAGGSQRGCPSLPPAGASPRVMQMAWGFSQRDLCSAPAGPRPPPQFSTLQPIPSGLAPRLPEGPPGDSQWPGRKSGEGEYGLSEDEREPWGSCWGRRQPWGGREKLFTDKPGPGAGASPPQLFCPGGALCPTDRAQPTGH